MGSPQIRNRGTLGGNLGTASPAGDALPPLLVDEAEVELASAARGARRMSVREFLVGPKQNALEGDELIVAVVVRPSGGSQTFMKVGPRNAMVIAVCSLAVAADRERDELRASFGSAGPVPGFVRVPMGDARSLPDAVVAGLLADRRRAGNGGVSPPRARRAGAARSGEVPRGMRIEFVANGEQVEAEVWPGESLLFTLRERVGLPGSKNACEQGECGSCSVLLDGKLVCSCLVLAAQADGHEIATVEGLADGDELHPVQSGVRRGGGGPVRVLHAGARSRGRRPPGSCAEPERGRDPRGAVRQPLPLHGVPEDRRRGEDGGRKLMSRSGPPRTTTRLRS